jgi:hypothetical protein
MDSNIAVPRDYFGLNTGRGSLTGGITEQQISSFGDGFGLVRSHDNSGISWKDIEKGVVTLIRVGNVVTAQLSSAYTHSLVSGATITIANAIETGFNGTYIITVTSTTAFTYTSAVSANTTATTATTILARYFKDLDAWVAVNKQAGRKLIYTVYQTPEWASARPTDVGPYGSRGFNAEPANMTTLYDFIVMVATRYSAMGYFIDYFEVSNEPNYSTFYSGTVEKLSEMTRTINQAAKSVYPTTKIICAGMTNIDVAAGTPLNQVASTYFAAMMSASDGATGTMAQWVDVIGYHGYGAESLLLKRIASTKAMAAAVGLSALPLIDTENGINAGSTMSDLSFYKSFIRMMIIPAGMGVSGVCYYALGNADALGYSLAGRPRIAGVLMGIFREITTYGITSSAFLKDGRVAFRVNSKNYII